ncbi:DNA replication ATP-dependent helicase/nuclease DNA2 [Gadus morhua]|uniref:DNA replication ATP-dependent helicase/nuclease n=1 Tax=Gadus morhua TaxID=8049 RepID=A0A8C5AII8_GADMO|nr:DNA replication ATP-dependent helicase/nuclease DNA2 [Gadus morhua]
MKMDRIKLKNAKVTTEGQRDLLSFFSTGKQKVSKSTVKQSSTKTEARSRPSLPLPVLSPIKRSVLAVVENILPLSPDLLLAIPETPDSQIRPSSARVPGPSPNPSAEASSLGGSPLCRSPSSRRVDMRRKMRLDGERENLSEEAVGSGKRLFSPEDSHAAKRPRTGDVPAIHRWAGSKASTPVETLPAKQCLTEGRFETEGPERIQSSELSSRRSNQVTLIGVQQNTVASPTPLSEMGGLPREESVFTLIMDQRDTTPAEVGALAPSPQRTMRTPSTAGGADGANPTSLAVTAHIDDLGKGATGATDPAGTSSEGDGRAVTSSDLAPLEFPLDEKWFEDEMEQISDLLEQKKAKASRVPDHVVLSGGINNRYWVLEVEERPGQKTLTITCSKSLQPTETCLLKDGWETSPVSRGSVVHLEGQCVSGCWRVEREQGFLVVLPDVLISGTSISNSIRCMRRAVLSDMFKSFDGGSKQMLNGTIVHEVFQKAAMAKDFSMDKLSSLADQALHSPQHLGDMYTLGVTQEEMKQELQDYLPSLTGWANDYLHPSTPKPIPLKLASDRLGAPIGGRQPPPPVYTVAELADIEENMWSPRFGLKGKIDVTTRVRVQRTGRDGRRRAQERVMPLELKTGKETNSIEHRSQVILYTLMVLERHVDSEAGLLLYLKTGNLHPVVAGHMDRRELLKLRNTLAHQVSNVVETGAGRSRLSQLPEVLANRQVCQYCPQKRNCALYERVVEGPPSDVPQDAVTDFLLEETGHLTGPHLSYFSHWLLLCCLESVTMEQKSSRRNVWLQSADEREKSGGAVGNLEIVGPVTVQSEGVFLHRFQRRTPTARQELGGGLADGDRVVVSDQEGRLVGLATGYMCNVTKTSVGCTLDRDLSKFSEASFRLDHDEGVFGLSTHLTNLSRLMENSPDSERLRELVVDLRPPQFIDNLSSVLPREAKDAVAEILKGLNKPQRQAMKKVLLSQDYTLIVGMPGTGKTTTICTLVRILHACGFSVLLTSYTHSAVDNILLKLKRFRVGFLRLGRGEKVHPEILPYTESERRKGVDTLAALDQLYSKELVVATTCMGTKHPIFTRRRFDFCIMDEASQISQPVCLGPLFYVKRFVLVGDHQQLPPIVQNQEARSLGMDESLFKRLELHSEAVVHLNVQYRMNRPIMSLSNCLMYDGRLECGSERTASARLALPFLVSVQSELSSHCEATPKDLEWVQAALLPGNPVCFLDTTQVPAYETVEQGGVSNHTEAALIHTLLSLLIKAGCKASEVGIIAPYRQQLKSISSLLQATAFSGVEVNTVDKYQGRDKSVILLSFVRSTQEEGNLGELLKDWRRLNVAVTRAKHKLLMVGSAATLRRYAPLEKLLNHLQQENMIIQLPTDAHKAFPSMHLL